ncbi:hypothetical protein BKI52_26575 [marine bacterium AO1-C]|nr:hypothetical protein BKI52_26575 [marine bacterium AO1-C]
MTDHHKYLLRKTPDALKQLAHIKTLLQSKQNTNLYLAFELLKGGGLPDDPQLHQLMTNNKLAIDLCINYGFYGVITQLHITEKNDWLQHLRQFYNLQKLLLENHTPTQDRLPYQAIFEQLSHLPQLYELRIWNHPLHHLPQAIKDLRSLTHLDLYLDYLVILPKEIAFLEHLKHLRLHSNRLIGLPSEIGGLHQLTSLDLTNNYLRNLPDSLHQLTHLDTVCLRENKFQQFPQQLLQLPQIKHLDLTANPIRNFNQEITQMQQLESLAIGGEQITQFPTGILQLKNLKRLELNYSNIRMIPPKIAHMYQLQELVLKGTRISPIEKRRLQQMLPHIMIT